MKAKLNNHLTRREFLHRAAALGFSATSIALLNGCGFFPAPTPAKVQRIGWLAGTRESPNFEAFLQGMRDLGYVDGKNITIEYRAPPDRDDQLPVIATELVGLNVDLLLVAGGPASLAAKNVSSTLPIVFVGTGDPVGIGLVASLAHPGGNVTGLTTFAPQLDGKRLEILKESVPGISRVAVLWNPTNPVNVIDWSNVRSESVPLGLQLQSLEIRAPEDFDGAFASGVSAHAEALFSIDNPLFARFPERIAELALKSHLPSTFKFRQFVDAGGLMSYGVNVPDQFRRLATYVDKIFKGRKPADLPVEQPTRFDFVINLKTAKALGLTIPQSVLAQTTEVIE